MDELIVWSPHTVMSICPLVGGVCLSPGNVVPVNLVNLKDSSSSLLKLQISVGSLEMRLCM